MNKKLCPLKIGTKIKNLREKSKISIFSFSETLKVSSNSVINWEKGNNLPSLDNVVKICNNLKISIEDLILYED